MESGGNNSNNNDKKKEHPTAHRLRRAWRSLASSLVVAARAVEHASKVEAAAAAAASSSTSVDASSSSAKVKTATKAVDNAMNTTLKARAEFRKAAAIMDGKLRGNAKEAEALELYLRSQPCFSSSSLGRKRKREDMNGQPLH